MSVVMSSRALRAAVVGFFLAALLVGILPEVASAATPGLDPATAEAEFLQLLNQKRGSSGFAPLARDAGLDGVARDWSGVMRDQARLHHRPNLAAEVDNRVTRTWTRLGENVGVGGAVDRLHQAFLNSPPHLANVLGDYNRVGVGVVVEPDGRIWVTFNFLKGTAVAAPAAAPPAPPAPPGPTDGDLWLVSSDGAVRSYGRAAFAGSLAGRALSSPIVGAAGTATGDGYWLVAADGGIFAFGDARFHGSTGNLTLAQPIVGMAATPTGRGYWLVARDGGIFAFGDARFHGSTGNLTLAQPIVGMAATSAGGGYWLVARDGGVFTFGNAAFHGGATGRSFAPITQIQATASGAGYRLSASDGRVFAFGDAGRTTSGPVGSNIVAMAAAR